MKNPQYFLWVAVLCCFFASGEVICQESIRLGTLATEESDWGIMLKEMNAELIKATDGRLRFALMFAMEEKRQIDLMRKGQFDAVSLTAIGLGQVLEELFIFELPMLILTYDELDFVRTELTPEFSRRFAERNYILLGWGDLGFTYLFSKQPIRTQTDLKRTRFWACDIDPIAEAFAAESGKDPVLAPIGNVLSLLKSNEIETVYASPYACLALQWHVHVKYMSDLILAPGVGATIMRKKRHDSLPEQDRKLLQDISERHHQRLIQRIRQRNVESVDVLKEGGIEVIPIPLREKQKWNSVALRVQNKFAAEGKFFPKELLERVRGLLEEYRRTKQP